MTVTESTKLDMEQLFEVRRVLNPDGTLVGAEPDIPLEQIKEAYRLMVNLRTFDQRCLNMQRQGRMGTFAPFSGQEACQVGSAFLLRPAQDWIFPTYRDHGSMHTLGVPFTSILRYFMGDEAGSHAPEGVNAFPISIPIATQLVHAMGTAWAAKIKGEDTVTVGYAGDGGTSPGDFHEALNFAAVFNTATVFFIQNNKYAISTPNSRQFKSKTIAQRALAYDIPGVRVDGQDLLAVLSVMKEAIERGRAGGGPTLVEALTFRYGPHTTSDDPKRYRTQAEVEEWQAKDPIERVKRYLVAKGALTDAEDEQIWAAAKDLVAQAVTEAEAVARPSVDDLFNYLYADPTPELQRQRESLKSYLAKNGEAKSHG
ncbi:MAG TPA: pyruvate dehydrogenase (acetyl-transferring) E1 component subunit alpha [Symbiobacteriaceae bacterium]|jgi:pyruvate dehydrogenase E1 component alpha subunit|nr:pyruvate dehydrogenase (acetyl-transferring) E1 component subunit alpha [Symbiobacteriaceae bacterium]